MFHYHITKHTETGNFKFPAGKSNQAKRKICEKSSPCNLLPCLLCRKQQTWILVCFLFSRLCKLPENCRGFTIGKSVTIWKQESHAHSRQCTDKKKFKKKQKQNQKTHNLLLSLLKYECWESSLTQKTGNLPLLLTNVYHHYHYQHLNLSPFYLDRCHQC